MELSVNIYKALNGLKLNVQLEAGEFPLALLGASGTGKTAVLRCIAGLLPPDAGRITLDEQVFYDSERGTRLPPQARRVGMLVRDFALFPYMTVRQNIAAGLPDPAQGAAKTDELLHHFHLEETADAKPRRLTREQRFLTALARVLASEPRVLLLDEPLAALDDGSRSRMELELSDVLADFEGPVIWVSHDRGEIYRNCRYVCVLEEGVSQETVTVTGLFAQPRTETAARLAGCGNFADAIPRENAVYLPQWGVTLRCAYPLPPFLWRVGIQARSVRIADPSTVNAFTADVVRVVDDVSSTIILLRPVGAAEDAPLLRMELDRGVWQSTQDRYRLTVTVSPQDILLLK